MGSNVIRFQLWDQIQNPLIKAHLLDTTIKKIEKRYFWPPIVISNIRSPGAGWGYFFLEMKRANLFPEMQGMIKS